MHEEGWLQTWQDFMVVRNKSWEGMCGGLLLVLFWAGEARS
jgi:hypothetical protein